MNYQKRESNQFKMGRIWLQVLLFVSSAFFIAGCGQYPSELEIKATIESGVQTAIAKIPTNTPELPPAPQENIGITQEQLEQVIDLAVQSALASASTPVPTTTPTMTTPITNLPRIDTVAPTLTVTPTIQRPTVVVIQSTPTKTATPTPMPTSTVIPEPVFTSVRPENLDELRRFTLDLINEQRVLNGVAPVVLGDNQAAQLHAEDMLTNGYLSHWNIEGFKPYMRYAMHGGTDSVHENVSGPYYYVEPCRTIFCVNNIFERLEGDIEGFMESPGHRRNILDPWHNKVSLGIAFNGNVTSMVQHFEDDYMRYFDVPVISSRGELHFAGTFDDGWEFLNFQLTYDTPPSQLTFGQLGASECYQSGIPIAIFREPPGRNAFYTEYATTFKHGQCREPNTIDPNTPKPAKGRINPVLPLPPSYDVTIPWINADHWISNGRDFEVKTSIDALIDSYGDGVYSLLIWGEHKSGEFVLVSEYPIFIGEN